MGVVGAILGDIAGSQWEFNTNKDINNYDYKLFGENCCFTDDTVMSIATIDAMHHRKNFEKFYVEYGKRYPDAGYGQAFRAWIFADEELYDSEIWAKLHPDGTQMKKRREPYNSYGNGSAMRCGYIGQYYKHCPFSFFVKKAAKNSAKVTHNHPEGIKGAITIAMCVWMAERGKSKEDILQYAISQYPKENYKFSCELSFDSYKSDMTFSCSCMRTVPIAIRIFYENDDFETMCKKINCLPCDTDTICAMAGSIFESYYHRCTDDDQSVLKRYLDDFLMRKVIKYC